MINIKHLFKTTSEIDLSNIKPGSIVFVWGTSLVSRIIAWWEKREFDVSYNLPSHVEIYFGSGKHETISAEARGVTKTILDRYIGKSYRLEVYSYSGMTVEQLMLLKGFAYGRANAPYDFIGLVGFLFKKVLGKVPHLKRANFCSELLADCFYSIGMQIVSVAKPSNEQCPAEQWEYIKSNKVWIRDFEYNNLKGGEK